MQEPTEIPNNNTEASPPSKKVTHPSPSTPAQHEQPNPSEAEALQQPVQRPPKFKQPSSICHLNDCSNPIARVIGNCRWCTAKFCLKHRLPEAHSCQNISGCKAEASNGLAKRLLSEKCISNKV